MLLFISIFSLLLRVLYLDRLDNLPLKCHDLSRILQLGFLLTEGLPLLKLLEEELGVGLDL